MSKRKRQEQSARRKARESPFLLRCKPILKRRLMQLKLKRVRSLRKAFIQRVKLATKKRIKT